MREKGIQVKVLPSRNTVYFENTYGENQDNRTQRVLAKADPFTVEELKDEKPTSSIWEVYSPTTFLWMS